MFTDHKTVDPSVRGPLAQAMLEIRNCIRPGARHGLDATVFKVAHPTLHSQFGRQPPRKCTETHALNSARDQVVFGDGTRLHSIKLGWAYFFGKDFMPPVTQSAPLAKLIDHTLLKPEATRAEIDQLCAEAKQYGFASVCVHPFRVAQCAELLKGSEVKVCTVIGFPLGANRAEVKALETVRACADGAGEIDMVLNIGAVKDTNWAAVENEISSVVKAAQGRTVKVILETCLLSKDEIRTACATCEIAGADFVKTSTGFGKSGATVEDVTLMREVVGDRLGVKASGGVRDVQTMRAMVAAGATRIGTSNGVAIVKGVLGEAAY